MVRQRQRRRMSTGTCCCCGETFSKRAMTGHLESCSRRATQSDVAPGAQGSQRTRLLHLLVEGRDTPEYWLHLEALADATLKTLDVFLRTTWLECCGHMSVFTVRGARYGMPADRALGHRSMQGRLGELLRPGTTFSHEYDFGTTTECTLKVIAEREGRGTGNTVPLLARNDPPSMTCGSCGKPATELCTECLCEGKGGSLCDDCVREHACDAEMCLPVVNSPRVGMCGYTGEEDAP